MATLSRISLGCLTLSLLASVAPRAAAQEPPAPAPPAPAPETPQGEPPQPATAPGGEAVLPAPAPEQNDPKAAAAAPHPPDADEHRAVNAVFPPPVDRPGTPKREKLQLTSVGMRLGAVDFGAEADIVSSVGRLKPPPDNRRWSYALRGFFRAPARVGIGPETGSTKGNQLHSPPRIVGMERDEWTYINVAPGATGQLELAVTNQRVEGHVLLAGDVFGDAAYPHLDKLGGFSQAWVTLKAPALIGTRGGAALNVGAFSERFGAAGPYQQSTGYYGTYLFGRTHVAGESLVLDFDVTPDVELVFEHGIGAKVEVTPFTKDSAPVAPYLPNQGPVPQGSNFVHHAHASVIFKDWLSVAGHYLTSWSPNDLQEVTKMPAKEARMTIVGGEIHSDHPVAGNGYVGYSYIDAERILPLADGVQVLHGSSGAVFKNNYFGQLPADLPVLLQQGIDSPRRDDSGKLHTLLFQYILRAAPLMGRKEPGPDVALGVFGMFNHVDTKKHDLNGKEVPAYDYRQDKLKFGAELQVAPIEPLSLGVRFDRVMPDGGKADVAYSAISPRIVLHSKWIGREYVILNYTRYFLGKSVRPSAPYSQPTPADEPLASVTKPDENLISLTAMVAF
ncbi:MAG TPA: hypothetical protein VHB79_25695 [Polyangiaceae bacterium]|nr:hypothetical protein [Polyangiaceae bacterium]